MRIETTTPCIGTLAIVASLVSAAPPDDLARYVDPFVGTGAHGHTFPGATVPFGMVQLSPDTRLEGWDGCSGYHATDTVVYGFSHTHLSGTGISDYGDVLLMPVTGEPQLANGAVGGPDAGYASRFDKRTERAAPGHYSVELADYDVAVDLTVTDRTGLHRYRFPEGVEGHVIVDLVHRDEVLESSLRVVNDREIEGVRRSTGWALDQWVHFVARFSRPFSAVLAEGGERRPDAEALDGRALQAVLSFGAGGGELTVQVGISAVDVDGARRNLDAEWAEWDLERVRSRARSSWNEVLGRVEVDGGTETERRNFYTGLYHSFVAPNLYSDVDGRYRGLDQAIHVAEGRRHYTVFSLWDTFRATHPLFTLIAPERVGEMVETFLAHYRQGGRLPVWELAANETDTMIGYHSVSVIAEAWAKGIRSFDAELALEAMLDSAERDHFGLEAYRRQGYVGADDDSESVSKTLEYAYDDACIARFASARGEAATAARFSRRSQAWRHVLDPETGFMRARRNQRWVEPFDPRRADRHYTEANAWQYSFFVPHDVRGLIDALGGDAAFVERLDRLFEADPAPLGPHVPDISGMVGQYAHGNEPSHHMAWLYHYAGRPDRSAERVRTILDTLYAPTPEGLSGNEDCGQMSSWYVLSAIGLYPVTPCSNEYVLGSPLFERVVFRPPGGEPFAIEAPGASSGTRYVNAARLNGKPYRRSAIAHTEIASGGELHLEVGPEWNGRWGSAAPHRPYSGARPPQVLAAPYVRAPDDRFRDRLEVELVSDEPEAVVHYRPAGTPAGSWRPVDGPLVFTESTTVHFYAARGREGSPTVTARFHRIPNDWQVRLDTEPNPRYTAGGADALVDGLPGAEDWRLGGWQGYDDADLVATVDLGELRPVARLGARFLQDVRSWIWMPRAVVVSTSVDGESFVERARFGHDLPDDRRGVVTRELTAEIEPVEARYVRVRAERYGIVPDWHPGAGGEGFVFVDELLID